MSNLSTKIFVVTAALFAVTGCVTEDEESTEGQAEEEVQADPASTESTETNTSSEGEASSEADPAAALSTESKASASSQGEAQAESE